MKYGHNGFTLVELAIVITIIGLLIGGVLKGQEMLLNAKLTNSANTLTAYNAAATTFKDIYKALPGDISNPSNFLQNCTAVPCSTSGDNNGILGSPNGNGFMNNQSEDFNFFVHLGAAGLIQGVNPYDPTMWDGSVWQGTPSPLFPAGGRMFPIYFNSASGVYGPDGHYWHSSGTPSYDMPTNVIAKYDLKFDDGKPKSGDVIAHPNCTLAAGGLAYDPNNTTLCHVLVKVGF